MADTLARINLLTDLKAMLESATEDGTPGIATDYAHRLGWLSGGSWKWGALRGGDEEFASIKPLNIAAGYHGRTNASGVLVPSAIQENDDAVILPQYLAITGIGPTQIPVIHPSGDYVTPSVLTDDGSEAYVNGSKIVGASWACIYINGEGVTAQSIPNGATYTKITPFTADLPGAIGCAPSHAADNIVVEAGVYTVGFTRTYLAGTNNVTWHIGVFVNGVLAPQTLQSTKNGVVSVPIYADMDIPVVCAAGDTIDIRVRHDQPGAVNLTYEHATLYVARIA